MMNVEVSRRHQIKWTILAVASVPEVIADEIALLTTAAEKQCKEEMKQLFKTMETINCYLSFGYSIKLSQPFCDNGEKLRKLWRKTTRHNPHKELIKYRNFYNDTSDIRNFIKQIYKDRDVASNLEHFKTLWELATSEPFYVIEDLDLYEEP